MRLMQRYINYFRYRKYFPYFLFGLFIFFLSLFFYFNFIKEKKGLLYVDASLPSDVYIDGIRKGKTPYESEEREGEALVRIVPDADEGLSYEARVKIVEGVRTIVRRMFEEGVETSSFEIISFERNWSSYASVSVVSVPDGSQVFIDGQNIGYTPIRLNNVLDGKHIIRVHADGFGEKEIEIIPVSGYNLTYFVGLSRVPQEESSDTSLDVEEEVFVSILDTPTGFLRVRQEPNLNSVEMTRVLSGEKYRLSEINYENGWFRIFLDNNELGWISGEYAATSSASLKQN